MTRTPTLIGLTGPAGSGKDSVADVLVHEHGFQKMAFADALRAEVCAAFFVPIDHLTSRDMKEHPLSVLRLSRCWDERFIEAIWRTIPDIDLMAPRSPRQILQWWGTEYRRAQSATYWTDKAERRIRSAMVGLRSVVVTDVRFDNEAATIRSLGGTLWQLQRPGLQPVEGRHPSAVSGSEFAPETVIENDGDLVQLAQRVAGLMGVVA